jgi:hypothetical protein
MRPASSSTTRNMRGNGASEREARGPQIELVGCLGGDEFRRRALHRFGDGGPVPTQLSRSRWVLRTASMGH